MSPHFIIVASFLALGGLAVTEPAPPVTLEALRTLLKDPSSEGTSFVVTGAVNFCCLPKNDRATIDLADRSGKSVRLYASTPDLEANVRLGDIVEARGLLARNSDGKFSANVTAVRRLSSHAPYRQISGAHFFNDANRLRIVALQGTVRECFRDENSPNWIYLVLYCDGRCINATMFTDGEPLDFTSVLGRKVELVGWAANASSTPRKRAGRVLAVADVSYLKVLDDPNADAFDAPALDTIDPTAPPEDLLALGLHSIRGTVLAVWGKNKALVRTTDGMLVDLDIDMATMPACGARIVALGLPATNFYHLQLEHVRWRPDETPPAQADDSLAPGCTPAAVSAKQHGRFDLHAHGERTRIEGTVRHLSDDDFHGRCAYVETGGTLVPVDCSSVPDILQTLAVGCRIAATGTCIIERTPLSPVHLIPTVQGFRLAVCRAKDVKVLRRPSWWTPARVWTVSGFLLLLVLAFTAWNVSLRKIAAHKGRALAREQISRAEAELRIDERTRLAIELHDTLSQNLMGVAMRLDAVVRAVSPCSENARKKIGLLSNSIKYCREELRQCLWDLRSEALEISDMNEVIRQTLLPHVGLNASVAIRFNVPRSRLTDPTVHALIRIIRELTLNAIHHGKASQIKVAGSFENGTLLFSVTDNGCGFDVGTAPGIREGHFGLQGIRERINLFGGTLSIGSQPGKGTKVTVHIRAVHNQKAT